MTLRELKAEHSRIEMELLNWEGHIDDLRWQLVKLENLIADEEAKCLKQ